MSCRKAILVQSLKGNPAKVLGGMQYRIAVRLDQFDEKTVQGHPVAGVMMDGGGDF